MKVYFFLMIPLFFMSCSEVQLVDNWKVPDINYYQPEKVLVVGLTSNIEARTQFEQQLKNELELRGSEVVMSLDLFEPNFTSAEKSEKELKIIENILIANGFDTVLISKVIGIEDKIAYKRDYDSFEETYKKFTEDYLMYQDIYYNPQYYDEYSVYHAETSMYCICPTKDRELIWKGYIDIVDPQSIEKTIDDYVRLVIAVLEEQNLINPKITTTEEIVKKEINL